MRFSSKSRVAGYDPDEYWQRWQKAGKNINALRRMNYAENKEKINAQKRAAYASYFMGGNFTFIRDDATVSDVLEEMYHAMPDRKNLFSEFTDDEIILRREIDATQYLLSVADKYKIPVEEVAVTRKNLENYQARLEETLTQKKE